MGPTVAPANVVAHFTKFAKFGGDKLVLLNFENDSILLQKE
jgi:hypothetical protein